LANQKIAETWLAFFPQALPQFRKLERTIIFNFQSGNHNRKAPKYPKIAKSTIARLNTIAQLELGTFRRVEIQGVSKRDPATGQLLTYVNVTAKIGRQGLY
jgi:hypothetical protein